jgi:hypothetical protein
MKWLWNMGFKKAFFVYIILDIFCVGLGMGIPFFSILLGFPVGWYLVKRIYSLNLDVKALLSRIFKYATISSGFTLLMMLVIWGMIIPMLWDPNADFANFGIPMILYDPKASFIGWLILMIIVSPFLQFLVTIFSANLTVIRANKSNEEI